MPIYEFRCDSCGHSFEELIFRQSEVEQLVCPKCGKQQVNRLMSAFSSTSGSSAGTGGAAARCGPGAST